MMAAAAASDATRSRFHFQKIADETPSTEDTSQTPWATPYVPKVKSLTPMQLHQMQVLTVLTASSHKVH